MNIFWHLMWCMRLKHLIYPSVELERGKVGFIWLLFAGTHLAVTWLNFLSRELTFSIHLMNWKWIKNSLSHSYVSSYNCENLNLSSWKDENVLGNLTYGFYFKSRTYIMRRLWWHSTSNSEKNMSNVNVLVNEYDFCIKFSHREGNSNKKEETK